MNPNNADTMMVTTIRTELPGTPSACDITNIYDIYSWVMITSVNNGANDRLEIWQLDGRKEWFNVEPEQGRLNCGESQNFILTLDAARLPEAPFEGDLIFNHNASGGETRLSVLLEVLPGVGRPVEQTVLMDAGWNIISLNVEPEQLDVVELMRPLVEAGRLNLIKDGVGRFYSPAHGFSNMVDWSVLQGYQVNLSAAAEWMVEGLSAAADTPIPLSAGWNMVSYLPHVPVDAVAALANIHDQLDIAKDGWGRFYMPDYEFSNMGNLAEGFGYQLKVNDVVELVYNVGQGQAAVSERSPAAPHYAAVKPTGANMSALLKVEPSFAGGEIAVTLSDGQTIGSGLINAQGWCGLALWGDDPATAAIDGAAEGAVVSFALWDGEEERAANLSVRRGEPVWSADGVLVGDLNVESAPVEIGLAGIYPNPFNTMTRIEYGLAEAGRVRLALYDLTGRLVINLRDGVDSPGRHSILLDGSNLAAGIYVVMLRGEGFVKREKLALVK